MEDCETMEDVYMASVETDRGVKEQLHLYDTRGLQEGVELPKHYFSFADGFVLVYSVNNLESFQRVELLKKEIDKFKDKKEVAIVVLGNKIDLSEQRQVDAEVAQQWARSEKVRLWESLRVCCLPRSQNSLLMEPQQVRSQKWVSITAVDKLTQARGAWVAVFGFLISICEIHRILPK
ncbi:NF-kappa-B inhibitor-interacting Ras-like protein 1 isoform X4 [Hyaena hyaena]|nr:NF-kappa-B inhibitor-interacting Ras-like protein 1 isoform X4 [Hyaena hyaena]